MIAKSPLEILWQGCQAEQVVLNIRLNGERIEANTLLQQRIVSELQELLGGLFPQAQTILVEPMSYGFSDARVLKVQPFHGERGGGLPVVIKFGDIWVMKQEYENYQEHVLHYISGGRSTHVHGYEQTPHLAGIAYTFLGTAIDQMQEFHTFYEQATSAQVKHVLDNVFRHTCSMWYANHHTLRPLNLTEDYQRQFGYLPVKQLEHIAVGRLPLVSWGSTLEFTSLGGDSVVHKFPNPFYALKTARSLIRSTYVSTTHGDLNQRNILIDGTEYPWLIDFQSTGPSHILRDVVILDTVIRLQLLRSEQATLEECLALEEALCNIKRFSDLERLKDSYSTINPALAKTWEAVIHLRTLAHWMVEKNPYSEMSEYFIALLYVTMNTLQFSSLEERQCEHALLSASLLVDALKLNK